MKWKIVGPLAAVVVALGVLFFLTRGPDPVIKLPGREPVWEFDLRDLRRVEIAMDLEGLRHAWYQSEDDLLWYFDEPGTPPVDLDRWGGGVPYLLSGPGANRLITDEATDRDLENYGLDGPRMAIHLEHAAEHTGRRGRFDLLIGDQTIDGISYYIMLGGTREVFTIDYTWYDIMERLVVDPPYLPASP